MLNWSINIGDLISAFIGLVTAVGGLIAIYAGFRTALALFNEKLSLIAGRLLNVENEVKDHSIAMKIIDRQDERIAAIQSSQQQERLEQAEFRSWIRAEFASHNLRIDQTNKRIDEFHGRN